MKVFVLAPKENWICDRIAKEWRENNQGISTNNPQNADVLWLLAGWCWNQVPVSFLQQKKIVLTVHHIVPGKFDNRKKVEFKFRDQFVDAYHVPNEKTKEMICGLTGKPIYVIPYWYDGSFWIPQDKKVCRERIQVNEKKFVVGSFQRDTEGGTRDPKLEKGPDILCDFLESIKDQYDLHVLLGGWRREYVMDRLSDAGIQFSYSGLVSLETVRDMYNACDLYVVSSRFEGGPQALFEAAAMSVPIISTDVGLAYNVLSENCIVKLPDEHIIPTKDDVQYNFENVQKFDINVHKNCYISMFSEVVS